jgi:hypothetical protein
METRQVIGILLIVLGIYVGINAVGIWVNSYPSANIALFLVYFAVATSLIFAGGYLLQQKRVQLKNSEY